MAIRKQQEPDFAPITEEGKRALTVIHDKYQLPTPPPLTVRQKVIKLPADLSDVHDDELGALLAGFAALQDYASYQMTLVGNDIRVMTRQLEQVVKEQYPNMMGTITEKKARAQTMPVVVRLKKTLEDRENVYDLINTLRENYERDFQAVSREISRRSPPFQRS